MNALLPSELIFFVTARCHLRCKHCFNWNNLQRKQDLSLAEIESLAKSLPQLRTLSISGGEPFLRKDIVDICRIFAQQCRIQFIDIPTSGTLIDTTVTDIEEILKIEPSFKLAIGISIDGMESYHDSNRGISGTFSKAMECCTKLLELKKRSKRLSVNILTTLVQNNKEELIALKKFVADKFPGVDDLSCVIARGDLREGNLGLVSPDDLACMDKELLDFNFRHKKARERAVTSSFYELRREAFLKHVQPVPCIAGNGIAVVYDDGSVAPCEMLPPVGNLRNAPFDVIWNSSQMMETRAGIASGNCACTHECFLSPSYVTYLLEHPISLIQLEGMYGLYHFVYAKCGLNVLAKAAKKIARKLRDGSRE